MLGLKAGEEFPYLEAVTAYCNQYVLEPYREEFLRFIQPDAVREGLKESRVISYRYMVRVGGRESYEVVRFAGVRHPEDREDHLVHAVGACFADVDEETRRSLAQNEALNAALAAAEEANKAKTAFLSNMSHEIRTPMNAIIGLNNIAMNDGEISEKTRGYLTKIGDSAEHLLNLINDILDMSRIESGRMILKNEEFSFPKLLEAINTMFSGQCQDKGLDYQCHIRGQVDDFYIGDNMKLRQVLINILGNAVKFTPKGGRVEFLAERTARYEGKTTLRFTISDTGIGMSKEYLPRIFDTFSQENSSTTNRYGSSGLGMAITRNIVEMMNGNIQVESEKGVGSTFTVTVTLMDSDRHAGEESEAEIRPQDMSVLIIDDDPVACEHAKLVLEKVGISSEIASSGLQAIEMVRLRHARRELYNLILVGWKMPEMDGIETTRRIREMVGDESAIIILTAYRWDDVLEEALNAGVDSFIPKPLFAASVIEEFSEALKRKNIQTREKAKKAGLARIEERAGLIGYPDAAMGNETYSLVKHDSDTEVTSDPSTLENRRIGVLQSAMVEKLNAFLEEHKVRAEVVTFRDTGTLFTAFDDKSIDILAAEGDGAYGRNHAEVLYDFGTSDYYLCVGIRRPDLLEKLNHAQTQLAAEEPNYINSLRIKYYPVSISNRVFSGMERDWLAEHDSLRIGYLANYLPYSDTDSSGQVTGLVKDLIPRMMDGLNIADLEV